jgi:hypothetical protein
VFASVKIDAIGIWAWALEETPSDGQDRGVWAWYVLHGSNAVGNNRFGLGKYGACFHDIRS